MDNVFITQWFDWQQPSSRKLQWANWLLGKIGSKARLVTARSTGEQTSVEQRSNLYLLAAGVLDANIPGSFVEIGCHRGSTAALLQMAIEQRNSMAELHLYDAFMAASQEDLLNNLRNLGLSKPNIHAGMFEETLPTQLPHQIALAHLDANWGQPFDDHCKLVLHCLEAIYPRLAPGGICVLQDYCEPDVYQRQSFTMPWLVATSNEWNQYPAVKAACDQLLADKPEAMTMLYGGGYSHGYFRKANPDSVKSMRS